MKREVYNFPNAITTSRFLSLGLLWFFALQKENKIVGIILIFSLLTDALDGFLARKLKQETKFGAKYDSFVDNLLSISIILWLPLLLPQMLTENLTIIMVTLGLVGIAWLSATIKFKRNPEFHLYSNKLTMVIVGVFIIHALLFEYNLILGVLTVISLIFMAVEELIITFKYRDLNENIKSVFKKHL